LKLVSKSTAFPLRFDAFVSAVLGVIFYFCVEPDVLISGGAAIAVCVLMRCTPLAPTETVISLDESELTMETNGPVLGNRDQRWRVKDIRSSSIWVKRGKFSNTHRIHFKTRAGKRASIEFTGVDWPKVVAFAAKLKKTNGKTWTPIN
jgi:hypothetical protein